MTREQAERRAAAQNAGKRPYASDAQQLRHGRDADGPSREPIRAANRVRRMRAR